MSNDKHAIKKYNSKRPLIAKHLLCHAPFSSLNFAQNGDMTACCYNRKDVLGTYPQHSIKQAWEGNSAKELRSFMRGKQLGGGCEGCQEQIMSGNFLGSKAAYYDKYASLRHVLPLQPAPPKVFEFEISNICNLECVMCNGYFSSAIRANREKLPKMHSPYDDAFIADVKTYLPYLTDAKFLGGEPFLISHYYEIWEAIIGINPAINVHITTNGTVLNKRAIACLEKMNAGIVISVDSLNKENYEKIRLNADFDELMKNIRWFIDYRNRKGLYLSFAVCPMISNRAYLADIIRFCNENDIYIHYNTVWEPKEECLRYTSGNSLQRLIEELSEIQYEDSPIQTVNKERTADFLSHIHSWQHEQKNITEERSFFTTKLKGFLPAEAETVSPHVYTILNEIVIHYDKWLQQDSVYLRLSEKMERIAEDIGHEEFRTAFKDSILFSSKHLFEEKDYENIKKKAEELTSLSENMDAQKLNRATMRNFDFITILNSLKDTPYEVFLENLHHLRNS